MFKLKYKKNVIDENKHNLKDLQMKDNPLHILMAIHEKNKPNEFLSELIELVCKDIAIDDSEVLNDSYYKPDSKSFTYQVLFHSSLKKTPTRQIVADQLLARYLSWKEEGMRSDELWTWRNHTEEQKKVANKIWTCVCEISKQIFEINTLISDESEKLQKKLEIIDIIPACLNTYCSDADDKQHLKDSLDEIANTIQNNIVRAVTIPAEIENLMPIAENLKSYSNSNVWDLFRRQQSIENVTTCYDILNQTNKTFDLFKARLNKICTEWKTLSISDWIYLFPDVRCINTDLEALKALLIEEVAPILKQILEFWNHRENFISICQGVIRLIAHLNIKIDTDTTTLMESIQKLGETITGEDCYELSKKFAENYSEKHSAPVLNIIARYETSNELVVFLHSLVASDVDNLLEAVNDWDETLINTKTVLDLVLIKTFLDRVYANLKQTPTDNIHEIIGFFENVLQDQEFKSLTKCFDSCLESLPSIKRVYADLTNKEQSKRRRIFDIVQNFSFGFIELPVNIHGHTEHRFDVSNKDKSVHYADLSELCDRARLLEYSSNSTSMMKRDSEQDMRELRLFVSMVGVIATILKNLAALNAAGHPSVLDYLAPKKEFTCKEGNYENLSEFSSSLQNMLNKWEEYLCKIYQNNIDVTYFSNQQIWMVEDYLYNQATASADHSGYHLLNFIGIQPTDIQGNFLAAKSENPDERLKNIARILKAQRAKQIIQQSSRY